MRVVVTDYIEKDLAWEAEKLSAAGIDFHACQLKGRAESEVQRELSGADIVVVNMVRMGESLLAQLPRCRLIIRHGIGYDNIDVPACTRRGILFAYQPDYCVDDVAEHAVALVYACARKLHLCRSVLSESVGKGQWDFSRLFPIRRMKGSVLGIAGVGRIGSKVFEKVTGMGFTVIAHDPYLDAASRTRFAGVSFVDKDRLFREVDYLTLHMPLTPSTRGFVDRTALALMKPSAFLVNTSRAGLVDVSALAETLRDRRIAGAAIDVFDPEPPPQDYQLFSLDNVILTPHVGWASEESGRDIRESIVNDIIAFAGGGSPRNSVNADLLKRGG